MKVKKREALHSYVMNYYIQNNGVKTKPVTFYKDKLCTTEIITTDPCGGGGNYCCHFKSLPTMGTFSLYDSMRYNYTGTWHGKLEFPRHADIPYLSFDWEKLPSSSEFNLILMFSELRSTMEIFKIAFWKNLTYGSASWGVLPFIGELRAVGRALAKYQAYINGLVNIPYNDKITTVIEDPRKGYGTVTTYANITQTYKGFVNYGKDPFSKQAAKLDFFGFHPDILTAWDSIPLSFLMNEFLPFVQLIDKVVDRGWVRTVSFTGWYSRKGVWSQLVNGGIPDCGFIRNDMPMVAGYERRYLIDAQLSNFIEPSYLQAEMPTMEALMNVAYIMLSNKVPGGIAKKLLEQLYAGDLLIDNILTGLHQDLYRSGYVDFVASKAEIAEGYCDMITDVFI